MSDIWSEDLTPEETDRLLDKAANEIKRRKMQLPAVLFLEMHKPLSFVGSQAAVAFSPFLVPFLGWDAVNDYSRLFSKRENVDALLNRIDSNKTDQTGPLEEPCSTTTPER